MFVMSGNIAVGYCPEVFLVLSSLLPEYFSYKKLVPFQLVYFGAVFMLWWISQCCLSDNTSLGFCARPGRTGSESRTSATEVWLASSRVCGIRTGWMSPVATQYGGGGRGREGRR